MPPAFDARTDAELVASARAGDGAAFEAIMRRNNRLLFRTARGVVSSDEEARDVVQEAYLHAFTRLESFRGEAALSTWLARITINAALSAQRKQGRIAQREVALDYDDSPSERSPENSMALRTSSGDSPDVMAERSQVRDVLQAAVENLPAIYRSVFILRAVEDMSVAQTAYCLDVSDDVVKTRFLRARTMLRQSLAEQVKPYLQSTFSFAGADCDAVVHHVLDALRRRGMVRSH
ncbi:RNA polymerase sigma factor [Pandoraea sp. XY-2]|uniref:RNA polymerase sigma factor n=1 Tax=Pandoraea sp. XY-2 TaxID=2518599 RepID=UPI00101AF1B4|nr:RNA polymerase sigma factor [Pandoraea sp. XY-2]QBC30091.1 RNA polymerase sigma factor [Pandoraea sp. XY-2]